MDKRYPFTLPNFRRVSSSLYGGIFEKLWNLTPSLNMKTRKAVVMLARAQFIPDPGSTSRLSMIIGFHQCTLGNLKKCHPNLHYCVDTCCDLILHPVFSSFVIDVMRSAPLSQEDICEAKSASFAKEIRVMEGMPFPSAFNYKVFFDPRFFSQRFHSSMAPNPKMAQFVYEVLVRWRENVCSEILFPRISSKKVANNTIRKWEGATGRKWDEKEYGVFNQYVVERFSHDTFEKLEGPTEMRQKWYRSQYSPRTYYAMGGTAFHLSKHTQKPMGDLVDYLPSTNHISRLNPTRIILPDGMILLIYDLSSFTSNHWEQRHFLANLSEFCSGYTVMIADSVHGFITRDLGLLLSDYNQLNMSPEYSMERIGEEFTDRVGIQNIAGFLGVYGNIASCTFLHGASVLQLVDSPDLLNVAGDDGHFPIMPSPGGEESVMGVIRANGVVETSKMFRTDEEGAVCLKRGIVQFGDRLLQKRMVIFPSLASVLDVIGKFPRQFGPDTSDKEEARSVVATEVFRFLRSLSNFDDLDKDDCDTILDYLHWIYQITGLPDNGSVPQLGGRYLCPVKPQDARDLLRDPLKYVIGLHWKGAAIVPKRLSDVDPSEVKSLDWSDQSSFLSTSTPYLSWMETLGYVASEQVDQLLFGDSGFDRLVKEYLVYSPRLYTYHIREEPPSNFMLPTGQNVSARTTGWQPDFQTGANSVRGGTPDSSSSGDEYVIPNVM